MDTYTQTLAASNGETPVIRTVGLEKNFGKLAVLRGVSERIEKGEVVSVIGPSGGGKSTFLRCCACPS